jgi:DNA-3-methyladenine glycosylase
MRQRRPTTNGAAQTGEILTADFFKRDTLAVARDLLGKFLVKSDGGGEKASAVINEVEAYIGPHDLACHGRFGRTSRTEPMFGPAGCWYVYFIYGMYWMLNIVTAEEGYPAAILIRGAGEFTGPGKLTRELQIDKRFNGLPASPPSGLWIEDRGLHIPRRRIERTPRIGVNYAGQWKDKRYRFVVTT